MNVETYREALLLKRGELVGGPGAKPLQWTMENNSGRQGDMADQATGNERSPYPPEAQSRPTRRFCRPSRRHS